MNSHASQARSETQAREGGKHALEIAGRVGYATKGVVYMLVGGLAAAAAWGAGGQTTGSSGAVAKIGQQPFGQFLLGVVAVGLAAYCLWRLVEAVTDPDNKGHDASGIATRLAYAVSGITYGLLAYKAAPFLGSAGGGAATGGGGADGSGGKRGMVAEVLSWPGGKWIVGAIGVAVIAYGAYQIYQAVRDKFMDKYDASQMSPRERKIARYSGKFGISARGVTFGVIGIFVVVAAVTLNPSKVKGVGEALDVLARQPYGMWVLLAVSIGLFCYGVFCLVQARYRHFQVG